MFLVLILLLSAANAFQISSSPSHHHRYYILRHGETDANAAGKIQGSSDFSRLTERGRDQAATVAIKAFGSVAGATNDHGVISTSMTEKDAVTAEYPSNQAVTSLPPMDHVYVSPLTRALETLSILRQNACPSKLPSEHTVLHELREIDLYGWEGRDKNDLQSNDARSYEAWKVGDPHNFFVDGKQPLVELWSRAEEVWNVIRREQQQQRRGSRKDGDKEENSDSGNGNNTLLVCHGSLGQALLCTACGLDETNFRRHEFPNCGLVEISWPPLHEKAKSWRWHLPELSDKRNVEYY